MTELPTDCVDTAAISPDDHLAYARGEAGPAVAAHLDYCAACRREAAWYTRAERLLTTALVRRTCPDSLVLGEYALDVLAPEARTAVAQHLVTCVDCLSETQSFSSFLAAPDAPAEPGLLERLRRLIARPVVLEPGLRGVRGDDDGDSVTYEAEGVRLTVSIQRSSRAGGSSVLVGLLEQGPDAGAVASLYRDDTLVGQESIDDLGNFLFNGVRAGQYRVEVEVPPSLVVVNGIAVT